MRAREHSPLPVATDGEAANPGPRLRRRGPRSAAAQERRRFRNDGRRFWEPESFTIWHCNIRGWLTHNAELAARIRLESQRPAVVCLNETLLDKSVGAVHLEGYALIGRRDRCDGRRGGGVMVFAREDHAAAVTLSFVSGEAERIWCILHSGRGPLGLCSWYRPPSPGELGTIESFQRELQSQMQFSTGSIIVGDFNVHSNRWLHFSNGESAEGRALADACADWGMRQLVRSPARGPYLLDLALTDVEGASSAVLPGISDHQIVCTTVDLAVPVEERFERTVWNYRDADWQGLQDSLRQAAAASGLGLQRTCPDEAAAQLTASLLEIAGRHIGTRSLVARSSSHPWLSKRALAAVSAKREASGTPAAEAVAARCSAVLLEERQAHTVRTRSQLARAGRGSKRWWSLVAQLSHRAQRASAIPALRTPEGTWLFDAREKAEHLAAAFAEKSTLPEPAQIDEYPISTLGDCAQMPLPAVPDTDAAVRVLRALALKSATGPDGISTRLLRECAEELALPVCHILEQIIHAGKWPSLWREHWLVPIHKRKSVFAATNYRGIHLTAQLSKVVERLLQKMYAPFFADTVIYGPNQFAYSKGRGARDAMALMVLTWLCGFDRKKKYLVYCSDVAGAFDRVNRERLEAKLAAKGVHPKLCAVFGSWLQERRSVVVVAGAQSAGRELLDMVFQGTVTGPPLWNVFYEDSRTPVRNSGYTEVVYADDLNAFKEYPLSAQTETMLAGGRDCQRQLHAWGRSNQVQFDPSKESTHVLSRRDGDGTTFRILGVAFDSKLTMSDAARDVTLAARWRVATVLRARRYLAVEELVATYKGQVLSYIEYRTPALYHAADTILQPLDKVQESFLREIGISETDAILYLNLAPLSPRRDLAMLGVIHRTMLKKGPEHFEEFFVLDDSAPRGRTRSGERRHSRHLADLRQANFSEQIRRSALGLIPVYNLLPADIVALPTVAAFQSALQRLLKIAAAAGRPGWQSLFSPRVPTYRHPLRHIV